MSTITPILVPVVIYVTVFGIVMYRRSRRDEDWRKKILACSGYARALPEGRLPEFAQRVREFVEDKDFVGRGLVVTDEMKVMVGSCAVQLTFGLPPLLLMHFSRIVIHADKYRSRQTGRDHVGEVNPGFKAIVISWKHFEHGYAQPTSGRNVGLHEMAHALLLENRIENAEHGFLDDALLVRWRERAGAEIAAIRVGGGRLFRDYAGTDQWEFFAVAIEYFFEQPRDFQRELPELYDLMRKLLKQDPAQGLN